jgi:transposase
MTRIEDLSRSLVVLEQNSTVIAVVEMSASSWLVGGLVPGIARRPMKKLTPDPEALLQLLQRWREEAQRVGRAIGRMVLAYEIGRDGFWLARWLRERGVEAYAIHPASVAVSQEHKRAKTDRLDVELLQRVFLGWLRGERDHCSMAAIPTLEEEDARRPGRERELLVGEQTRLINRMKSAMARLGIRGFKPQLRKAAERLAGLRTPEGVPLPPHTLDEIRRDQERLALVRAQIKAIEQAREQRLQQAPAQDWNAMILFLARVVGLGIDTADTLVQGGVSPRLSRPASRGQLCGDHRLAPAERFQTTREGVDAIGQCQGTTRLDPAHLALSAVPEGLRAGAMVPGAGSGQGRAQVDHDRGVGPQAARRAVAHGHDRRGARRPQAAARGLIRPTV